MTRNHRPLAPVKANATYADIEALPEGVNGEILGGELWVSPRPAPPHAASTMAASSGVYSRFDGDDADPGGWRILFEPELHLGDDVMIPDIAGWRLERMPTLPKTPAFHLAPDWICETASPSTQRLDRAAKLPRYAGHGVEWAWIIDPLSRHREVYHRSDEGYVLVQTLEEDAVARVEPFAAVELELGRWWVE